MLYYITMSSMRANKKIMKVLLSAMGAVFFAAPTFAAPAGMIYPVIGSTNYSDTFLAYRAGQVDNKHHAIDIFAPKMSKIISPVDGIVRHVSYPEESWGWYFVVVDADGYEYHFMHVNNDTPGTDDGMGGAMNAYSSEMRGEYQVGNEAATRVVKGQLLGYVGDSGNAETTPPHLHFEIVKPEYTNYDYRSIPVEGFENPFTYLNEAPHIIQPVIPPQQPGEMLPFGLSASNSVSMAAADFTGDKSKSEYVVGAGVGGMPQVRLYNSDDSVLSWGFGAYANSYRGGVNVASGDVDGDGIDEIITGTNPGSTTHVRVFEQDGTPIAGFFAYDGYYTGVNVASADLDGDGKAEIITGTGSGSTTHVKAYRLDGSYYPMGDGYGFFAYPGYYIGADVAAGDVNGDGKAEIVTSTNKGSTSHVKVFDNKGELLSHFFAYGSNFYGGAQVAVANIDKTMPTLEILTSPNSFGTPDFRVFDDKGVLLRYSGQLSDDQKPWEQWWIGSYNVTALDDGNVKVSTGENRRSSIRTLQFK